MEDLVARALVGLPLGDQAAEALVEQLLVDDDVVGHVEGRAGAGPSNGLTGAGGVVEEREEGRLVVKVAESSLRRGRRAGWVEARALTWLRAALTTLIGV